MARVRIVHWKPAEAEALLETCRAGGFEVEFDPAALPDVARTIRRTMPDALVIDLTRVPSHGRELAFAIRRTKYTRQIPIVFVDGEPEKVEAILAPEIPDSEGGTKSEEPRQPSVPDLLVMKAKQTGATVTFIEDGALLESIGGVGAFLRWRE